jgi:predicted RNA-binding Zn ribbon-like protein
LREAIWGVFSALASGEAPREEDLALIGDAAAAGVARSRLVYDRDGASWSLAPEVDELERPLWSIARSATDLLMSPAHARIRECASPTCDWVFLDQSRNRSRRWCDMSDCGNREKARRFQQRKRATRELSSARG